MDLQRMFKAIEQKHHLARSYILPLSTLAQHQRALMRALIAPQLCAHSDWLCIFVKTVVDLATLIRNHFPKLSANS
jgi:hypothetical protein